MKSILDSKKNKSALIIGINFAPEITGIGRYTGEMVKWLCNKNVNCTVITAYPYYPQWQIQKPYKNKFYLKEISENGKLIVYRCPIYVPKKPNGLNRILLDLSFFITASFVVLFLLARPKIKQIYCIAPPFHTGLLGIIYKFFKGGVLNYHIQDLQIEAAKELKLIKSNFLIKFLSSIEYFILRKSSNISTISRSMAFLIEKKVDKKIVIFPNWVDCSRYYPIINIEHIRNKYGFTKEQKLIAYAGSIGEKQGIEQIILLAKHFRNHKNWVFIIVGSGPIIITIKKLADAENLINIQFLPIIDEECFNDFLNMVDIHLVLQKRGTSNLVMPSKLLNIFASGGITIVSTDENSEIAQLFESKSLGFYVDCGNTTELLAKLENLPSNLQDIRDSAARYAKDYLNINKVLSNYFCKILE